MVVVEVRGLPVIADVAAADRDGRCGALVVWEERHIHGGRIRIRDRAGVQASVRQYFARGNGVGVPHVDCAWNGIGTCYRSDSPPFPMTAVGFESCING